MIRQLKIVITAFALFLVIPGISLGQTFKVTRVYDGDTVKVESNKLCTYIMLVGIDAPEMAGRPNLEDQPFAKEAKAFLSHETLNKVVRLEGFGKSPYPNKCIISVMYINGKNINLEMVRRGLAEVQQDYLPEGFDVKPYLEAEKEAKAAKRGIWSLGDKYISPEKWRSLQKKS